MALVTETRRYSVDELLSLRTSLSRVSCLVKNINKHPEIASIFRIPEEAFRRPEHFSCTSAHLAEITNRPAARQLSRKNLTESSEQSEIRSLDNFGRVRDPRQVHWSLRRRDNSDRSSQPHSAPTGFAVQQSENFQKFYRAVVSPSHVRVTAGGRIVPNTRSPVAPSPEGNGDKIVLDSKPLGLFTWAQDASPAHPQVPGGFLPLYNFPQPPQPMPVDFPIMSGPPAGFYGTCPPEHYPKSGLGPQLHSVKAEPIKISPPTQFDQTKPFTYNGQIVYPIPYGLQPPPNAVPVPMGMLGNPNVFPQVAQQPTGGLMPTALPLQFANLLNPMAFAAAHQSSLLAMPSGVQGSETYMPYMPMHGLIASDYTKSQIQFLQNHCDYIGTLLVNDKHRIDKAQLEHQRAGLLGQINHLKSILQVHLRGDGSVTGTSNQGDTSGGSYEEFKPMRSSSGSFRAEAAPDDVGKGEDTVTTRSDLRPKSKLTIAAAMAPPFQPRSHTTAVPVTEITEPRHAMPLSRSTSAVEDPEHEETHAEIAARLMASSTTDWLRPGFKFGAEKGYTPMPSPHEFSRRDPQSQPPRSSQRSSISHGQVPHVSQPNYPEPSTETIPYLVGTLPAGISSQIASPNDLVYSRPLTDDEVRARYLYWGKAPRSVQSGLPKFDGKDFYPPSPIKKAASLASDKSLETQVSKEPSEKLYPFRLPSNDIAYLKPMPQPIFTDAMSRGTLQQPSSSSGQGLQNWGPHDVSYSRGQGFSVKENVAPSELDFSKLFMEKGCPGYRSPSPKPSTVRFNAEQDDAPVTPQNATFFDEAEDDVDDAKSDDSWQPAGNNGQRHKSEESVNSVNSATSSSEETNSTVEIKLSAGANGDRFSSVPNKSFDERVENFKSSDEQTMFLQKMLRNEGRASTPSSGTISSATAQGYLPQYRGSAAASLAPAEYVPYKSASSTATSSQSDNRPLGQGKNDRHGNPAPDSMSATEYLRYVSAKAYETEKSTIDRGWNPNTTAFGPVLAGEEW
ncbi:uncharacterized protein RAG0_03271 [Rhynchosporium agropyri]|uniref:Uncharacterized protein n=1 Tax=Rhynchosporium agropyri TaxID=914238 RepID=A0A1E1K804_9HELO|nr:uncharacterized protein RAG0_03271 [Rhynchosporium agropyri]